MNTPLQTDRATTGIKRVFVIGCPRSGTTWTTMLLEQHPCVVSMYHTRFFIYLNSLERWWRAKEEPNPRRAVSKKKMYRLIGELAGSVMDGMARHKPGARAVIEKTPEHLHFWRFIYKSLPDAYFIHVIRDPRSVFSSLRNSSNTNWAEWSFPTRPYDGARLWCDDVRKGRKIATVTDRYFEVRYEDLHDRGIETLQRMLAWLGLEASHELCEQAFQACRIDKLQKEVDERPDDKYQDFFRKGARESWREELSEFDIRVIEHVAGEMMQELGYARAYSPLRKLPLRIALESRMYRLLTSADQALSRWSRLTWRIIRGREPERPEVVIYP